MNQETEDSTLTDTQYLAIEQLRLAGWVVALWNPNTLKATPCGHVEAAVTTYGDRLINILSWPTLE